MQSFSPPFFHWYILTHIIILHNAHYAVRNNSFLCHPPSAPWGNVRCDHFLYRVKSYMWRCRDSLSPNTGKMDSKMVFFWRYFHDYSGLLWTFWGHGAMNGYRYCDEMESENRDRSDRNWGFSTSEKGTSTSTFGHKKCTSSLSKR